MRSLLCLVLASLLTVGAGLPGLRPAPPAQGIHHFTALTEIKGGENGHYYVKASINNQTADAPVDTGPSAVALSHEDVRVDDVDAHVMPQGALRGTLLGMSSLSRLSSFKSEGGALTLKN